MEGRLRCFIGLPLPPEAGAALDRVVVRLGAALRSRVSFTRAGNWHITLKFLGDVDADRLAALGNALAALRFDAPTLALGGAGGFFAGAKGRAPGTLWLGLGQGAQACAQLAAQVDEALAALSFARETRPFRPHVTIGRVKAAAEGDDWGLVERELARERFSAWRAGELVLWRSILGPQGPKYVALHVVPARDHGRGPGRGAA